MPFRKKTKSGYSYRDTPQERMRHGGDCLTQCIAYIIDVHPFRVPLFVRPRYKLWWNRVRSYLDSMGYKIRCFDGIPPNSGYAIVVGTSSEPGWEHAVVYKNGKMVFDPSNLPTKWRDNRCRRYFIISSK